MANSRWLKAVPKKEEPEQTKTSTPNVSMRDVRRLAQEKAAREAQSNQPTEKPERKEEVTPPKVGSGGVTPPDPTQPIAPARDFNKRANSLEREALPAGIFPGSSKRLYDALYVRTRGAVVPARSIRATKRELSDWSGIRNVKTLDSHLRYFGAVGLIISSWERGQNDGATYEVLLPEETSGLFVAARRVTPPNPTSPHVTPPNVGIDQNLGSPHHQNLGSPHHTQVDLDSTVYKDSKTSFKTNTERSDDDDAALAGLNAALKQAAKELTGKDVSPAESSRWRELAEVLITEAKIAGARTTVSSFPAFLAEHLRRRLWKKDKNQLETEGRTEAQQSPAAPALTEEQIKSCPDCGGSTWYYPEGPEKGIRRCRHEKLREGTQGTE